LKHVKERGDKLKVIFSHFKISQSDYSVHAGFNESLIKLGVGYVQEIHIFTSAEIPGDSPLLTELGKLFFPYPGILFTPSYPLRTPVFKDDGSIWDFEEFVLSRAKKYTTIHSSGDPVMSSGIIVAHAHSILDDTGAAASTLGCSANRGTGGGDNGDNGSGSGKDKKDRDRSGGNGRNGDPEGPNAGCVLRCYSQRLLQWQ
jgi:hypothetical protein